MAFDSSDSGDVEKIIISMSDHVIDTTKPADYDWNWGENLLMRSLVYSYETTGKKEYFGFVLKWLDIYCIGSGRYLPSEVDDVASGFTALLAYEKTGRKRYLTGTKMAEDFLLRTSPRLEDGTIIHNPRGQLWLDTLYMITPFLAHLGKVKDNPKLMDMAADQIMKNINKSEDPATHLSYHMWEPRDGSHSPHFWARGNSWVVMATVEVLEILPENHPLRQDLIDMLTRRCRALVELQDKSGLWHTILDRPDSYLEVSASAIFSYTIQRGVARGWLPQDMLDPAVRALDAIAPFVQDDGTVLGVSAGTGPGDFENYQKVPTGEYTWGTGGSILAFSERLIALRNNN